MSTVFPPFVFEILFNGCVIYIVQRKRETRYKATVLRVITRAFFMTEYWTFLKV